MWKLFDELIALVPEDLIIRDYLAGAHWNLVRTSHVGMAMTLREVGGACQFVGKVRGMLAKDAAALIKSWNPQEAALGLATINSFLNAPNQILESDLLLKDELSDASIFECMRGELTGKRVAVVGHFRGLESLAQECELTILERKPQSGDMPDPACEYILRDQDYVFITGTTLMNKTLPRLLELSRGARVVLVGPSTPMTPILFDFGIDILAGTTVLDTERVWTLIQEGDQHLFFDDGARMVKLRNPARAKETLSCKSS